MAAVIVLGLVPAVGAAPGRPAPIPGERVLTPEQRALALAGMPAAERARREAQWSDPELLPVAYARALFAIEPDGRGGFAPVEVGTYEPEAAGSNLRLPSTAQAATYGNAVRYDLYISVAVVRMACSGCYQWGIDNFADWKGAYPAGMDAYNGVEDTIATAWAGGLYLHADSFAGEYNNTYPVGIRPLDIYRSDVSPNAGVGWSFHEWRRYASCPACWSAMNWGDGTAYVRQTKWMSRTDNVMHRYFHTKGFTGSYELGFPCCASVHISPSDSNQWAVTAFASFSH